MKLTRAQIFEHIEKFHPVCLDGKEVNPLPKGKLLTVLCEHRNESFILTNVTTKDMGLDIFIVKSWIYEEELQALFDSK